ncbi:hypothetical protein F5B21DRAFT_487810 [Xylaria acuta]|nr:hypothetical protein F5B21DRAFT_487810 [Xylaria acuta]
MKASNILATALLAASTASGWDLSKRCENYPDLCLLSFIWCDYNGHCSLPSEVYPREITSNTEYPLILSDTNYTIQWQAKRQSDVPVRLKWSFGHLAWETNVTGTEFIFNPGDILNSFPTQQQPNASVADAWYAASQFPSNIISISRANMNKSSGEGDYSQQFMVQPGSMKEYLGTQIAIEYNKWKLGVGIGVGLGVPFLLAVTALITWLVCKKTMKKPEKKQVEMASQ